MRLELRDITKRFPGVLANDHISIQADRGKVLGMLGENGAGKTTLMNILSGLYKPDSGQIFIDGEERVFGDPVAAIKAGVGMVHQHFMLVPVFDVVEAVALGAETVTGFLGTFDRGAARKRIVELSEQYKLEVNPDAKIENLPVGVRQRVEILKALYRRADILILDEPTAVLTPQEASELFTILNSLKTEYMSIIFISHKLNEVLEIADRITVLRRGKIIGTVPVEGATEPELARMMVGRDVVLRVEKGAAKPAEALLDVSDLHASDDRGVPKVRGLSFQVRAGEIVGIAGVDGNGQTELIDCITGLRRPESGTITVAGKKLAAHASPREALEAGMGHVPEDRHRRGLVLDFTLAENLVLHDFEKEPNARHGWLFPHGIVRRARKLLRQFDVRGGGPQTRAAALSGGNQQKVVLAREIGRDPRVLLAAQPTRGLDVGAIEFVHRRLVEERDEGRAILLVSLELDEILSLSDRILVVYEGQIVGEFPQTVSEETLGIALTGGHVAGEAAA